MKIKAIVVGDDILFDSFAQLQEHNKTQPLPDYDEDTVDLTILVETEKGGFSQGMKIGPNALIGCEPHILEALVFETIEASKVYQAGPPFETNEKLF